MGRNALREEFARRAAEIRKRLEVHDRGVLLGVALSLLPLFPVALAGLLLGLFNRRLHRDGKLSAFDYALARKGLLLAAVNSALSVALLAALVHVLMAADPLQLLQQARQVLAALFQLLFRAPVGGNGGVTNV